MDRKSLIYAEVLRRVAGLIFRIVPGVEPSKKHDLVETKVQIIAVPKQTSGKMVEVCRAILRDGRPTPRHQYPVAFNFDNAFSLNAKTEALIKALASNGIYARVPGKYNLIHILRTFSSYTNLAEIITHRMISSVATKLHHAGMVIAGNVIKILATNKETQVKVFVAEAEVEQLVSALIFTSQGSQGQGFVITFVVKNDPKELPSFWRTNYMSITYGSISSHGSTKSEKIIKDVTEATTSYTYYLPMGLFSAAKLTEPALTLMEKASWSMT
ncbi:hypothetical protein HOY82DRAFT_649287 [Tuber indicum]|nr:hypothetical protein HOY82DRAFT_649287 [Tuber indicum]